MKWFVFGLRVFVVTGVLFAVVDGVWFADLAFALISGAVFGVFMALVVVLLTAGRLRGRQVGTLSTHQRCEFVVPVPIDAVHERARRAISTLPATTTADDGRRITARTKVSWLSWGEIVSVELWPGEMSTALAIDSRPRWRTTMADYGRNHENVDRLAAALSA